MHQERTSKGLNTAIQVTNQVTEQLLSGATSASDAAMQMEEVIKQLRRLVGE
jgi:methyl-accepting chemotaxis protein